MDLETSYLFKSDFVHDLKLQKEFLRGSYHANVIINLMHLFLIGILLWFYVEMVFILDAAERFSQTLPVMTAIWLVVEGIQALSCRGGGIGYKRNLLTNNGQPMECSVQFYEDHILTLGLQNNNKTTLSYDQIKSVYETRNLILCAMKYRMFLIVDKRGLGSSREAFLTFLLPRCPKIRRKKVHSCKSGQIINAVKWGVIIFSLLVALFYHPTLQLNRRLQGQIHNGMHVSQIAEELENFGISGAEPELITTLEESWLYLSSSKLENILCHIGMGNRDYETGTWTPADSGVFFTYYWAVFPETMYTDLLQGIAAMSGGELTFENILEDQSDIDWANYAGSILVDFTLNGESHSLEAVFYEDWYDEQILNDLNEIITKSTGKSLYFADYDEIGCFIFYADANWAQSFADRTGLKLATDVYEIYK